VVTGRVVDGDGRPMPHTLVEIWQANAAGRYAHDADRHPASLDPNFIARLDLEVTEPDWALAYRFDVVLGSTPFE